MSSGRVEPDPRFRSRRLVAARTAPGASSPDGPSDRTCSSAWAEPPESAGRRLLERGKGVRTRAEKGSPRGKGVRTRKQRLLACSAENPGFPFDMADTRAAEPVDFGRSLAVRINRIAPKSRFSREQSAAHLVRVRTVDGNRVGGPIEPIGCYSMLVSSVAWPCGATVAAVETVVVVAGR